jgi:hypothetical protein
LFFKKKIMVKNFYSRFFFLSSLGSFWSQNQSCWFWRLTLFNFSLFYYFFISSFDIRLLNLELSIFSLFLSSRVIRGRELVK